MDRNGEVFVPVIREFRENPDRLQYPSGMYRVSGGPGGEVVLLVGRDKTGIVDCGMPFDGPRLVANIRSILGGRNLDYVFASHTHYDHIGGLAAVRKAFPNLLVYGSNYAKYVFTRPGAIKTMKKMTYAAIEAYKRRRGEADLESDREAEAISYDGLVIDDQGIDISLDHGDWVDMGDYRLVAYDTPGHTNCSMSYFIPEKKTPFSSESTGVPSPAGRIHTSILKSFDESMASLELCRRLEPESVIFPHYGLMKGAMVDLAWDAYEHNASLEKASLQAWIKEGLSDEDLLDRVTERFWTGDSAARQPKAAFQLNAKYSIQMYRRDLDG